MKARPDHSGAVQRARRPQLNMIARHKPLGRLLSGPLMRFFSILLPGLIPCDEGAFAPAPALVTPPLARAMRDTEAGAALAFKTAS